MEDWVNFFIQGMNDQEARITEMLSELKRDQDKAEHSIHALNMQLSDTVFQFYQEQKQENILRLHQTLLK